MALVYDLENKKAIFYLNGSRDAETPFAGTHALALNRQFWVGSNETNGPPFFKGDLDDMRIYDATLDDSEVLQLYGNGGGDFDTRVTAIESTPSL